MKIKGIAFADIKAEALQNQDVMASYLAEKKNEELREILSEIRTRAGLNSTQVAQRMGITQPAISKLENNAVKASISTLERYAAACNAHIKVSIE